MTDQGYANNNVSPWLPLVAPRNHLFIFLGDNMEYEV